MSTDHNAFLAAILANPDEDAPRLIYADWLEEQGDAERAEFIREQINEANSCAKCADTRWTTVASVADDVLYSVPCDRCNQDGKLEAQCPKRTELTSRAETYYRRPDRINALLHHHGRRFAEPFATALGLKLDTTFPSSHGHWGDMRTSYITWHWKRGFIHHARCSADAWLTHCSRIVQHAPMEQVHIADFDPMLASLMFEFRTDRRDMLRLDMLAIDLSRKRYHARHLFHDRQNMLLALPYSTAKMLDQLRRQLPPGLRIEGVPVLRAFAAGNNAGVVLAPCYGRIQAGTQLTPDPLGGERMVSYDPDNREHRLVGVALDVPRNDGLVLVQLL